MTWVVAYTPRSIVLFAENNLGYKLSDQEVRQRGTKVQVAYDWQARSLQSMLQKDDNIVFIEELSDV